MITKLGGNATTIEKTSRIGLGHANEKTPKLSQRHQKEKLARETPGFILSPPLSRKLVMHFVLWSVFECSLYCLLCRRYVWLQFEALWCVNLVSAWAYFVCYSQFLLPSFLFSNQGIYLNIVNMTQKQFNSCQNALLNLMIQVYGRKFSYFRCHHLKYQNFCIPLESIHKVKLTMKSSTLRTELLNCGEQWEGRGELMEHRIFLGQKNYLISYLIKK